MFVSLVVAFAIVCVAARLPLCADIVVAFAWFALYVLLCAC